jgi:probable rRNA maturation factor
MITIRFINAKEWGINTVIFKPLVARLKKAIGIKDGLLNVIFVNDVYIRALNKSYRKKNKATDVLSFNYDTTPDSYGRLIGEIYISMDTAKKQAKEYRHTISEELSKLFIHGFLHIHGFDHQKAEDFKKMSFIEQKILDV